MTEKLYYKDTRTSEFDARVVGLKKEEKGWRLILDRTYFYPEGGGQPADKGWINDIPVTDVQKVADLIYHYLPGHPGSDVVRGKIDLDWRMDFMQQHTGQHIISASLWKVGGYKTVSVHMGSEYTTIEIDAPEISQENLNEVERLANRMIKSDLTVSAVYAHHSSLDAFPLRKPTPLQGEIRLVRIGDFDCVACGGLHLDRTREVGLVKAVGREKIRSHMRLVWKIGARAYEDYRQKDHIIARLRSMLDTGHEEFVQKVETLQEDLAELKSRYSGLETRWAELKASQLYESLPALDKENPRIITESWKDEDGNLVKKIVKNLMKRESVVFCLVNVRDDSLQWSIGCSADVIFSFEEIKNELLPLIDGRGGGRHPLWQGSGTGSDKIADFIAVFRNLIVKHFQK